MLELQGSYFQFTCLPNGLSCAPLVYTKILKPVYAHLQMLGHTCTCITVWDIAQKCYDCVNNIHDTVDLFTKFGFIVHPEKSILKPSQEMEFLGFIINSLTMTVGLSASKSTKVQKACQYPLKSKHITVSSPPAVQFWEQTKPR